MKLQEKIKLVAESYLGQEEISGNKGFKNTAFQKKMKDCGWELGQAWCSYFAELVWKEAFGKSHPLYAKIDRLFSPSATATFANFKGHNTHNFESGVVPKIGALVVWKYGNSWKGHIGVVTEIIDSKTFRAIEGNTNNSGSREGIMVAKKTRSLGLPHKNKGLNLLGFIYSTF